MVKMVKSAVKCYKKKTKKSVAGKKKTYEYNQYLVPLKRSDNLDCSMEVFIIPQSDFKQYLDENGEFKDINVQKNDYKMHIDHYKRELADLEWKHSQLSRSYKDLLNKHNKTRRKQQELHEKIKILQNDKIKLINALKIEKNVNRVPEIVKQEVLDEKLVSGNEMSSELDILKKATTAKEKSVKTDMIEDIKDKEDKDIWTVIKSRLSKKEEKEK
ncbi:MAG: hypothetical protein QM396_01685 [Euryarchaeota archaeon]|jgi:hypothetical protein|uniref:hypothetical protein n=1 Tax=Methanobacterium sp. MZD130B TaxID=3394378 RepID=UPI00176BADB0|nr:hypothetical protein [Euryarchaeota archaeon]HHT19068.1 hypothetical protein [Methanobacterium sp.]